jgi:hypothetical protein
MATSAVALSLVDSAKVYYGFWRSQGTALPKGPFVTLSTLWYTFLSSAIALYAAWALYRASRIFDVLLFRSIYTRTRISLEESQCAVLVVNSKAALDAFLSSFYLLRHGGPKKTLFKIMSSAFIILILSAAIPFLLAVFPTYNQGKIVDSDCALFGISSHGYVADNDPNIDQSGRAIDAKQIRWSDVSLASYDRSTSQSAAANSDPTYSSRNSGASRLPDPSQTFTTQCPSNATCNPALPFTFASEYTLQSRDFGLNSALSFSVAVSDICYRPIQALYPLPVANATDPIPYGLFYGPTGLSNNTDFVYAERRLSPGYTLTQYAARANDFFQPDWQPNATLLLGGDTTILFYFVGGMYSVNASSDPIFATGPVQNVPNFEPIYESAYLVSPVVCDTKYTFCANDTNACSPSGGISTLRNYLADKPQWDDIRTFLTASLFNPPIYLASFGSTAVAASQTAVTNGGTGVQPEPDNATTPKELSRLVGAGMTMLASMPQLMVLGYWNVSTSQQGLSVPGSLCPNVLLANGDYVSVLLMPYLVLVGGCLVIVAISYAHHLGLQFHPKWKPYAEVWSLHYAGQLHRMVAELVVVDSMNALGKKGQRKRVSIKKWPALRWADSGLDVVEQNDGSKAFGPGKDSPYPSAFVLLTCSLPLQRVTRVNPCPSHTDGSPRHPRPRPRPLTPRYPMDSRCCCRHHSSPCARQVLGRTLLPRDHRRRSNRPHPSPYP